MLSSLPALPELPSEPARPSFPVVAVAAPVVGAVAIGLVTGSPFVLIFAVLSPLIAIGSLLDARRSARRTRRSEEIRFFQECDEFDARLATVHQEESDSALRDALIDHSSAVGAVLLGVAPGPSRHRVTESSTAREAKDAVHARRTALVRRSATNQQLPVTISRGLVRVAGESITARRLRRLLEQMPGVEVVEGVSSSEGRRELIADVVVEGLRHACVRAPGHDGRSLRLVLPSERQRAAQGSEAGERELPAQVAWRDLNAAESSAATVGVGAEGVVGIDLVQDGPHVLVGGTTGSGKSEFLRVLALSIAARCTPAQWNLLLVDFKGGATFADLEQLPHCVGIITDLDDALADRALGSLRAEIRRRERLLAQWAIRDLRDAAESLPRLLILVDEYAALVHTFPELQQVFSDLSARGRSLGIHLVLCTQRPLGVVRDAVVANCAIRVAFRMTEAADARAVLGGDAPDTRSLPPGRALLACGGAPHPVQIAMMGPADIARVATESAGAPAAPRPWAPVLPDRIELRAVATLPVRDHTAQTSSSESQPDAGDRDPGALAFGALDDVEAQQWRAALWRPVTDGPLAVLGASGSGRTTALACIAAAAKQNGWGVITVPRAAADAADVLDRLAVDAPPRTLAVLDDLDVLLAECPPALGAMIMERWDRAAAALRAREGAVAAVVGTATAAQRLLSGRFGARLCLRALDGDDHALSGAPRRGHDRRAPAGRAWWYDDRVQVAVPPQGLPAEARPAVPPVPLGNALLAVVAADPARAVVVLRERDPERRVIRDLGSVEAHQLGSSTPLDRCALVGDADDWQRAWSLWTDVRRQGDLVLDGVTEAETRSLLGARAALPPVRPDRGEVVYRSAQAPGGSLSRARWPERLS